MLGPQGHDAASRAKAVQPDANGATEAAAVRLALFLLVPLITIATLRTIIEAPRDVRPGVLN